MTTKHSQPAPQNGRRAQPIKVRKCTGITPAPEPSFAHLTSVLEIAYRPVGALLPYAGNARTHSERQIAQIAASIRSFGFTNPILIDADGGVVAGHGRLEAARQLGMASVPTIRLDHLSAAEKRAYVIADNRLAELAGWDRDMLKIELGALIEMDLRVGLDFDIGVIGFETAEIDILLDGAPEPIVVDPADATLASAMTGPAVTCPGDLWILGEHRILCADALRPESYTRLMGEERARLIFTDPPYNVPVDGHVCGLGAVKHREFAMAAGEMSAAAFTSFLETALSNMAWASVDGALLYTCMDWRHLLELLSAGKSAGLDLINICIWNKSNGGMGSLYRSKHELVSVFKSGGAPHVNTVALGKHGRYRTNVWDYTGVNTFRKGRMDDLAAHPTVKPTALVADAIKDCSRRGEIVLDAFLGSGTTVLAAERTARRARAIELDPIYVDVAIRRWQALTDGTAILEATGQSFAEREEASLANTLNVTRTPEVDHGQAPR
jgi:DNA modification methylase